jgi:hypothetical protein
VAEDELRVDLASAHGPIGCTERDRWHSEKPAVLLCAQFAVCCHTLGRIVLGIARGGSDGGNDALPSWRVGASLRGEPPDDRPLHDRKIAHAARSLAGRSSLLRSGVGASPAVSQDVPVVAERVARLEVLATANRAVAGAD